MAYVHDDDDESELDDREFPDEGEGGPHADDDSQDADTDPCPFCHKPIYADADICPHCRNFVAIEDLPPARPWWYWAGLAAAFTAAALWALFG